MGHNGAMTVHVVGCLPLLVHAIVAAAEGGGWHSSAELGVPNACNVDTVRASQLSLDLFEQIYAGRKPVLIRKGTSSWAAHTVWTREYMRDAYGTTFVHPATNTNGPTRGVQLTFGSFLDQMNVEPECTAQCKSHGNIYIFEALQNIVNVSEQLRLLDNMPYWRKWHTNSQLHTYIAVGPIGTGLGLHEHGEAWNVAIWGKRRWILFNPADYPCNETNQINSWLKRDQLHGSGSWLRDVYPHVRQPMLDCVQNKGDVVYVPEGWMHTVFNLRESVAISHTGTVSESYWPKHEQLHLCSQNQSLCTTAC